MKPDRTPALLGAILAAIVVGGLALPQWLLFILTIACAQGLVVLGLSLLIRAGLVSLDRKSVAFATLKPSVEPSVSLFTMRP